MEKYYLAVDIGASSGRCILGKKEAGRIVLEEIHRFPNGMKKKHGHLVWDTELLFQEILAGMKKCKALGKIPSSVGIDTWGVDYVLLDKKDQILGEMYGYRDSRTSGMDRLVYQTVSEEELYTRTGIQKLSYNTIYQLMAVKTQTPDELGKAKSILFVPDYFNFLLTGKKKNEYTVASTSQFLDPVKRCWDRELISRLGYPEDIFGEIVMPGTNLGPVLPEIENEIGYPVSVVIPCSHDTGSAVLAVPAEEKKFAYISSGTWSLLGTELDAPDCSKRSLLENFTNEGGYNGTIRYLKNIMGLWMIKFVRHEYQDKYSFAEICSMAEACREFQSRVNVNDSSFLAPDSMTQAIQDYCRKSGQEVPQSLGEIASVIYASLAECYADALKRLEMMTGCSYDRIYIVGGGANADYLNRRTASILGKEVITGPVEATAVGNIMIQMIAAGEYESVHEARRVVQESFDIHKF